jgi:aflatoxin B1 aldehyde reductase
MPSVSAIFLHYMHQSTELHLPSARALEAELEPCLRKFGFDLVVYNPLCGGLFSGKYTSTERPAEGRFSESNSLGKMYVDRYFNQSNIDALAIVEPVAKEHGIPLIEVALRWCVHHSKLRMANKGGNDGIILGISSYDQLVQNVEACEQGPLPEPIVEALDKAWDRARGDAPTYWR